MEKFFNKVLLCFSLLFFSNLIYAQSDDVVNIPLEKNQGGEIDIHELPERDLDFYSILPTVFYNTVDTRFTITSPHVTFESVAYYIVDEANIILYQSEIVLPKGIDVELWLPQLPVGLYKIVLDFSGTCFQGEFEVES